MLIKVEFNTDNVGKHTLGLNHCLYRTKTNIPKRHLLAILSMLASLLASLLASHEHFRVHFTLICKSSLSSRV